MTQPSVVPSSLQDFPSHVNMTGPWHLDQHQLIRLDMKHSRMDIQVCTWTKLLSVRLSIVQETKTSVV